jgi:hypothetical protein
MADERQNEQRQGLPKLISTKDDAYYSNCTMLETTPFDISILFGKVRPRTDDKGQRQLVEVYERQIYLSHLQAKALYDALGRSLQGSQSPQAAQTEPEAPKVVS